MGSIGPVGRWIALDEFNRSGVDDLFTNLLEIDRDTISNRRLDLTQAPIRLDWMSYIGSWHQARFHGGLNCCSSDDPFRGEQGCIL